MLFCNRATQQVLYSTAHVPSATVYTTERKQDTCFGHDYMYPQDGCFLPPHVGLCFVLPHTSAACRAQKLITGLGGEKSRWTAAASRLGQEYTQLTGDVLLAAAQIAYLGAFTSTYRTECLGGWVQSCQANGVPCSDKFKLAAVLGDAVKVSDAHMD